MTIRVAHLYPEYLNIYADRGNIAVLARRAELRERSLEIQAVSVGEALRPDEHNLVYIRSEERRVGKECRL